MASAKTFKNMKHWKKRDLGLVERGGYLTLSSGQTLRAPGKLRIIHKWDPYDFGSSLVM